MTRTLIAYLALGALCLISAQPAAAAIGSAKLYDTVDEVQVVTTFITVTGIVTGQSTPSTTTYNILATSAASGAIDVAARCDRLALLAMSKPGKFQFGLVPENLFGEFSCKLIVRTP